MSLGLFQSRTPLSRKDGHLNLFLGVTDGDKGRINKAHLWWCWLCKPATDVLCWVCSSTKRKLVGTETLIYSFWLLSHIYPSTEVLWLPEGKISIHLLIFLSIQFLKSQNWITTSKPIPWLGKKKKNIFKICLCYSSFTV